MYYHVRSLSPYTEYELYVIVVNAIGRGPPSAPVTVTTGETSQYFLFLLTSPQPQPQISPNVYFLLLILLLFIGARPFARARALLLLSENFAYFRLSARLSSHRREIRSGISGARFESRSNENFARLRAIYLVTMKYRDEFTQKWNGRPAFFPAHRVLAAKDCLLPTDRVPIFARR